mgnify:CR=1 FL=1
MLTADSPVVAFGDAPDLCSVRVVTLEGSEYLFADISEKAVKSVLPPSGRIPVSQPALMMINLSGAAMTIPLRVVRKVLIGEEVLWGCPV